MLRQGAATSHTSLRALPAVGGSAPVAPPAATAAACSGPADMDVLTTHLLGHRNCASDRAGVLPPLQIPASCAGEQLDHLGPLTAPARGPPSGGRSCARTQGAQLSPTDVGASLHRLLTPPAFDSASGADAAGSGGGSSSGFDAHARGAGALPTSASVTPSSGSGGAAVLCCKRGANGLLEGSLELTRQSLERTRNAPVVLVGSRGGNGGSSSARGSACFDRPVSVFAHDHAPSSASFDRQRGVSGGGGGTSVHGASRVHQGFDRSRSTDFSRSKASAGASGAGGRGAGGRGGRGGRSGAMPGGGPRTPGARGTGFPSRSSSPALSSMGPMDDTAPGRAPPGVCHAMATLLPTLTGASAQAAAATDLQRVLAQFTPMLPIDASKPVQAALGEITLEDVWRFYLEPSMFGREVMASTGELGETQCYFVPYLSGMQLFTPATHKSERGGCAYVSGTDGWPRYVRAGEEHFVREMPFNRMPMYDHIEQLAEQQQQQQRRRENAAAAATEAGAAATAATDERTAPATRGGDPSASMPVMQGGCLDACGGDGDAGPECSEDYDSAGDGSSGSAGSTAGLTEGSDGSCSADVPEPHSPTSPLPSTMLHGGGGRGAASPPPLSLFSTRVADLHPASWYAVAWYPVYRIPEAPLCARFLTYHSFAPLVTAAHAPLPPPPPPPPPLLPEDQAAAPGANMGSSLNAGVATPRSAGAFELDPGSAAQCDTGAPVCGPPGAAVPATSASAAAAAATPAMGAAPATAPLNIVGLKWCNLHGERWLDVPCADGTAAAAPHAPGVKRSAAQRQMDLAWKMHLAELQRTAEWFSRGKGLHVVGKSGATQHACVGHPDFDFFNSRP